MTEGEFVSYRRTALASAVAMAVSAAPVAMAQDDFEEIVVTATRREQSVQDVPYNITAITADELSNAGVGDLMKLLQTVPGVTFMDAGSRANALNSSITLRGLTVAPTVGSAFVKGLAVPAVSTYIDEAPVYFPLKLTDVQRVEVLRGPQGTLYGSGSLAGTIRFIHNKPNPAEFDATVNTSIDTVNDGDTSYSLDGFVNIPLSDVAALRISASYEDLGGIVDAEMFDLNADGTPVLENPADFVNSPAVLRVVKDHDEVETIAVRAAVSVDFTDNVGMLLSWHRQETDGRGNTYRSADQEQYVVSIQSGGPADIDITDLTADVANLTIEADLGFASLTSSSSYIDVDLKTIRDITSLQFGIDAETNCYVYGCYPRGPFRGNEPAARQDFTQEIRLVSQSDSAFQWLIGGFYSDQESTMKLDDEVIGWADWVHTPGSAVNVGGGPTDPFYDFFMAGYVADPSTVNNQYFTDRLVEFEDTAVFGELTYNFTDDWQVTVGFRQFWQDVKQNTNFVFSNCGVFCVPGDVLGRIPANASDSFNDNIFKFNTSVALNDRTTIYGTIAEGFRAGGVNAVPVGFDNITSQDLLFGPDKATNYEIGIKGALGARGLNYTAAAYYIEWDDPQIDAYISFMGIPYVANGGEAEVNGVELALDGSITDSWVFSLGYNFTDSELKAVGNLPNDPMVGAQLPTTAEHQLNFTTDMYQELGSLGGTLHYHVNGLYKGDSWNALQGQPDAFKIDSFWLVNGAVTYETESWHVGLFVNNLFDETKAVWASARRSGNVWDVAARPRSIGIRAGIDF